MVDIFRFFVPCIDYLYSIIYSRHNVLVKTGNRHNSGTSANVYMIMYDDKGERSPKLKFEKFFHNDHLKRGQIDCYKGPKVDDDFGNLDEIEVWRDPCEEFDDWSCNWYCSYIEIEDSKTGEKIIFSLQKWLKANRHYKIPRTNVTLPQDDKYPLPRAKELLNERDLYKYQQKLPGLPMQIEELPQEESFAAGYSFDFTVEALIALGGGALVKLVSFLKSTLSIFRVNTDVISFIISTLAIFQKKKWMTTDDIKELYKFGLFPKPKSVDFYKDDTWFAARKLAGANPGLIELCKKVPEKFAMTDDMVKEFMEGRSLSQAIENKKLFIIDFHYVDGLPVNKPDVEFPAPMALFYLDRHNILRPIAIQLQQKRGPENPVFLPSDPANLWMLAKMWFNLADSMCHQSLSHLGFTHLLMEGICINVHRNLARNHPVFRLLAPHFLYLLAINAKAVDTLLSPGGFIEKTMQCGVKGVQELMSRKFKCFRFDVDGCLPEQIKARGMDSVEVLPIYPYRDDGLLVYKAIRSYVSRVLDHYYHTSDMLKNDFEIQAWGKEMAEPVPNGLGLQGIPDNGNFTKVSDLCMVITGIIFNCSAQHAAVNFKQYEEYAFPPNYPACLNAKLPRNKMEVPTDQDLVNIVADKKTTLDTMTVTKILSQKSTNSLGDWEIAYQFGDCVHAAEVDFRSELKQISEKIAKREITRNDILEYDILDPVNIPNAISI